jgi:nucleotide-binding universal stress UspA family protein
MNKILVGLDASDRARAIMDYAVELARKTGAKLVLFRAVGVPVDLPAQAFSVSPSQLAPILLNQATDSVKRLAASVPPELIDHVETDVGTPWQSLCNAASTLNADLIVVGSHGYGALDRLIGTTAARVVNHAPCPVLVVRNSDKHPI